MRLTTRKTAAHTVSCSWYVRLLRELAWRLDRRAERIVDRAFDR